MREAGADPLPVTPTLIFNPKTILLLPEVNDGFRKRNSKNY